MDIRNISQYIKALCGKEDISLLGSNSEPLLEKIFGSDPSPDQVKSIISEVASFAINAEEQLFYEFVQNAYDASADSLFFYANENYLVVLNNGAPFYTDFNIFNDNEHTREGQLYNFLARGKSLKWSDDNKLGKYGQGSKLLYTLLADVNEAISNDDMLVRTLYEEKKGPILISWHNRRQLANLLQELGEWTLAQGDDCENNILFIKILMSYYPVSPGTEYFLTDEAISAIHAFDALVDPRRNMHFLNRGTAIIVPLGKGKYEKIVSNNNISRVRTSLGCFASITKYQERNEGKPLEHIYVLGEEIEQYPIQSIRVEYKEEGRPFHYHFAFNHLFATAGENFVNFFRGLPIHDTKFRLGFIIDSQNFEVDSSRQRITDKDKTKRQLKRAFDELVSKLKTLHESDIEKFNYIYKAIVASQYIQDREATFVKETFQETFTPFLKEYVLTSSGTYKNLENVRIFKSDYNFPLQEIGINQYHWVKDDIADDLKRHGIDVKRVDMRDLIDDSDPTMMQDWIKSLSHNDYITLHRFLDNYKTEDYIRTHKLFRSNQCNLYSYEELLSTDNVYYSYETGMPFGECEHIIEVLPLSDEEKKRFHKNLFDKVLTNIDYFRSSDSTKEDAINLLCWLVEKDSNYEKQIKDKICLFQNFHDEYVSFGNLLSERPEETILFDNYCVKGYVPQVAKEYGWLLSPIREPEQFWAWLADHWQSIQNKESWDETNTPIYIEDIKRVAERQKTTKYERINLYLSEEGKPLEEERVVVSHTSRLAKEEYNYIKQKIETLSLQPYKYYEILTKPPFNTKTISINDIINESLEADKELLRIIVKISDSFLTNYNVQEINNGGYCIKPTPPNTNYIDNVGPTLEQDLTKAGLHRVPDFVQKLMVKDLTECQFTLNPELINKAIRGVEDPIGLLQYVRNADISIVKNFFNHLKTIDIKNKITEDDLQWQVIDLAIKRSDNTHKLVNILFSKLRYQDIELPNSIPQQFIKVGEKRYDVFKLDEDYKNDNETIISFINCLPYEKRHTFSKTFFHEKEEKIDVDKLYDKLKQHDLSIEQLCFCLHYSIDNNVTECVGLSLKNESETIPALEMILKNKFKGFDKYFVIPKVDYDKHIFATKELLRKEECLPDEIFNWINQHSSVKQLFSQLRVDGPYIEARRALKDDESLTDFKPFADNNKVTDIEAVIDWAIEKNFTYDYDSNRYKTMMGIIEHIPECYDNLPLLRYTGVSQQRKKLTFTLERVNDDCVFFSPSSWEGEQFQNQLYQSRKLSELIQQEIVYVYSEEEMLSRHKLNKKLKWKVSTFVDISVFPEYNDSIYKEWKTMDDSMGLTIHIARQPIERIFFIIDSNKETVFHEKMNNNAFGYNPKEGIVVQCPNDDDLSVMKTIAKYIVDVAFFKEPFIALQALYVDQWEKEQNTPKIDISKSSLTYESAQETINKISPETAINIEQVNKITKQLDAESLKKLDGVAGQINELLELSEEDLQLIAQNKDKLLELLNKEDEEKEARVNQIIGYIGELVYQGYLKRNGKKFEYSAKEGVGEYDFKIIEGDMYVDVKTTLYSLKDGTAPFYLHRSQLKFLKANPQSDYHIVRLSLIDLDLKEEYETLKKRFGRNTSPFENKDLSIECEKVANDFWENTTPRKFEEISQEYVITLVNQNKN